MSSPATVRVVDGWVEIASSARKAHEKEPAEAWLDRVLELPPGAWRSFRLPADGGLEIRSGAGEPTRRALPAPRLEVLRAFERRALGRAGSTGWQRGDGGGVVLCDEARTVFLLTRKDGLHPNPGCRGRLALVSGSLEPGETFREGALRELYEEVRDTRLADEAAGLLRPLGTSTLPAVQWPNDYRLGAFLAACPAAAFARWRAAWASDDIVSEASPLVVERSGLLAALAGEQAAAGSQFVASQHEVLRLALADRG